MIEKNKQDAIGQIYTPNSIAEFMVKNALSFTTSEYLKVLEPSVGEGVFLKYLIQNKITDITAYEIDENLVSIISKKFPGVNLILDNFMSMNGSEKFDLIIGNPPYLGQNYNADIFQEYIAKYPVCKRYFVGNMDLFYFFIHQAINKLKPGGILSFITTNYWITKSRKTGIKFLKPHVLDECFLIQYIDLSDLKVFRNAKGQHNCIFVMQKKSDEEKYKKTDKKIDIIKIVNTKSLSFKDQELNNQIFQDILQDNNSDYYITYTSALTNNDLSRSDSWNLLYPEKVKNLVQHIENFCLNNGEKQHLKDYFFIRNGLIFIQDDIFILKEGLNLQVKDNEYFIKIENDFVKLPENEKSRLKKIYKSRSILSFGFKKEDFEGYGIYFNKNEFNQLSPEIRNQKYEENYPVLIAYLKQFEKVLKEILINAKENPYDYFFPRRGIFFRDLGNNSNKKLIDVEPLYENTNKIFFKYISMENIFGFTQQPYYATSDTYFLWPRLSISNINYFFILAFFNSKIVKFLFKAKGIEIKRSKTKLEYGLAIPNLKLFISREEASIVSLISSLSQYLTIFETNKKSSEIQKLMNSSYISCSHDEILKESLTKAIIDDNKKKIMKIIDELLLMLFQTDQNMIDFLMQEYY